MSQNAIFDSTALFANPGEPSAAHNRQIPKRAQQKTKLLCSCCVAPTPFYRSSDGALTLYQADALNLLRQMRDESVDMIFADPPYFLSNGGITCVGGRMVKVDKGGWDKSQGVLGDHNFNILWLAECQRILKPNGALWVSGTSHNIYSVGFALQTLGYKILNDIAWYKVNPPPNLACRRFTHATETILWAARSEKSRYTFHYPLMKQRNGGKQMQSLWHILPPGKAEKRHGKHPTQKPEALLTRIVEASTHPGDIVLDPFCGSGTTGIACLRLNRLFMGIDQEEAYLSLAVNRLTAEVASTTVTIVFAGWTSNDVCAEIAEGMQTPYIPWRKIVIQALVSLGGEGSLQEINQVVAANPRAQSIRSWHSTVRRVVRQSQEIISTGRGKYRMVG